MFRRVVLSVILLFALAATASAATISGLITDPSGAAVSGARIVVRELATGREIAAETKTDGRYQIDVTDAGTYLLIVTRQGFAESARTLVVQDASQKIDAPVRLVLSAITDEVNVTASRSERETRQIPLRVESTSADEIQRRTPLSTGTALANSANITHVGDGPFGVRPRLRGLDSTRVLVLVDGMRLNTARQATERSGAEVGLVSPDEISRLEVVNGAGTLMYGSDALAGTINIVTNDPSFSSTRKFQYGFNGWLSSNETGGRGTLTLGVTAPKYAVRVHAGTEQFDNYRSGRFVVEDTSPFFATGQLAHADTIDDNFGFHFNAFPDPFNSPYVRTGREVPNSQAEGNFFSASGIVSTGGKSTLRFRYLRRRMTDVGFPDFSQPFFFNETSLPFTNLDRASARFEVPGLTPWFTNLSVTGYYQFTDRMLANQLPVQFPAPTPGAFFPISVMQLQINSETRQRVWTPGVDVQATLVPRSNHLVTAGLTAYRDQSSDERTTSTTTFMVGQVVMGSMGPAPVVFPAPIQLGPASVAHPVRVPNASLRDIGLFIQDEWRLSRDFTVIGGLRGDFYNTTTEATPGYDVASIVAGAVPPIDPTTLPDPAGATYTRQSLTGEVGLVMLPTSAISPFVRVGRSYRHPNLEEMLFAGSATVGSIAPNVKVNPEVGTNFDAGAKLRAGRFSGGAFVFVNDYRDFISQEFVATTPAGPLAQAINFADVRIYGLELTGSAPIVFRHGVVTFDGAAALTRGTIGSGTNPMTGSDLSGTPADNITPMKFVGSVRFNEAGGRWWVEYGVRSQSDVNRIATTLLDSPFLIAQDLLSLNGFTIQRLAGGIDMTRGRHRMAVTLAVENLTDKHYREQFQFAPARGRTFTVGFRVGAF